MGVVPVKTGRITLDGTDITQATVYERVRRGIGYVPQGREIFGRLTVEENLRMGLATKPGGTPIPAELFELFPVLKQMMQRRGGDLSGGQQQQLAIARALAAGPKLLMLDEPTEGIQPSIIKDIGRVIRMLADRKTMAIVLVEQYYDFAAEIADQYLVMERGEIDRPRPRRGHGRRRRAAEDVDLSRVRRRHVCQTRGAQAGNSQACSRQAARICCSRAIAGSTRAASTRNTITPRCGLVTPQRAANGEAPAQARATSSKASRRAAPGRAGGKPGRGQHALAGQAEWRVEQARIAGGDASAFEPVAAPLEVLPERAGLEGLAGRRQAQRQQVPAQDLGTVGSSSWTRFSAMQPL